MPSIFDGLSAEIFRETSTVFGEQWVLHAYRDRTNKAPLLDPDRAPVCFVGQFRNPHVSQHMSRGRKQARPDISTTDPSVLCLRSDFPEDRPPRQGDVIQRVDPVAVYDIADIQPNGHGQLRLTLLERGVRQQGP